MGTRFLTTCCGTASLDNFSAAYGLWSLTFETAQHTVACGYSWPEQYWDWALWFW